MRSVADGFRKVSASSNTIVLALVGALSGCAGEPPPARRHAPLVVDGDAVFFVGNSFFDWQARSLPTWVAALGDIASPPLRLDVSGDIVPGDLPLADFREHARVRDALDSKRYAVFVLQGHEYEPVDNKAEFHQAVRDFHREITAAGGRTALFMTWDFHFRPFIDDLAASYDEIGGELGIPVIPAGLVHYDCTRSPPPGKSHWWLTADADHPEGDLHQNELGTAVNAFTTFATLTGRDPRELDFVPRGEALDRDTLRYLAEMAWARASARLE